VEEFKGKATIVKVETDDAPDLVEKYGVTGLPVLVLLKDGQEQARLTGGSEATKANAKAMIEGAM